jgi:hypothetical protein
MTERVLPDALPASWSARWSNGVEEMPVAFLDAASVSPPSPRDGQIVRLNQEMVGAAKRLHGL